MDGGVNVRESRMRLSEATWAVLGLAAVLSACGSPNDTAGWCGASGATGTGGRPFGGISSAGGSSPSSGGMANLGEPSPTPPAAPVRRGGPPRRPRPASSTRSRSARAATNAWRRAAAHPARCRSAPSNVRTRCSRTDSTPPSRASTRATRCGERFRATSCLQGSFRTAPPRARGRLGPRACLLAVREQRMRRSRLVWDVSGHSAKGRTVHASGCLRGRHRLRVGSLHGNPPDAADRDPEAEARRRLYRRRGSVRSGPLLQPDDATGSLRAPPRCRSALRLEPDVERVVRPVIVLRHRRYAADCRASLPAGSPCRERDERMHAPGSDCTCSDEPCSGQRCMKLGFPGDPCTDPITVRDPGTKCVSGTCQVLDQGLFATTCP